MDEKKKGEIAYQLLKRFLREKFSFKEIANLRRAIGNISKEEKLDYSDLMKFAKVIIEETFQEQMDKAGMWAVTLD